MLNYYDTGVTVELGELVASGMKLWDFDYPSYYTGDDKTAFEQKVIDHFRFRQIGQETPGRFLHYFRARVREIMPYYIKMYESVALMDAQEDPFEAYNLVEIYEEETTGTGRASGSSSGETDVETNNTKRFSNTPGGSVDNLNHYLTEATVDEGGDKQITSGTSDAISESSGTVKHTLTRKGNIGVQPLGKEVQALRESYINVDMMIINDLNCLFLQVY